MSVLSNVSRQPIVGPLLRKLVAKRVEEKIDTIVPLLSKSEKILDIGSGNCLLVAELTKRRYKATPVDIADGSFIRTISPVIYDGLTLPFRNNSYDTALVVTVLHHVREPERLLREISRVAKRIIIIEEIYNNILTKYITFGIDSFFNLEFVGHPHTNKTDVEWQAAFKKLGLKLEAASYTNSLGVLQRALYVVSS